MYCFCKPVSSAISVLSVQTESKECVGACQPGTVASGMGSLGRLVGVAKPCRSSRHKLLHITACCWGNCCGLAHGSIRRIAQLDEFAGMILPRAKRNTRRLIDDGQHLSTAHALNG